MNKICTLLVLLLLAGVKAYAQPAAPTVTGITAFCAGNGTTLTASGDAGATFKWWTAATGGTALASTAAYQVPVQNTAGTYHFYVEQTASFQTSTRTDVTVTVNPTPVVTVSAGQGTICKGGNTTLTASGAATYVWTSGPTTATYNVAPTNSTTYTVTGRSAFNCPSAAVNTTVNVVSVTAAGATTICLGNSTNISASGLNTYSWSPGGMTGDNITVTPSATTTYTVTGTYTATGCTTTDQVTVTVAPAMGLAAMPNASVDEGTIVNLTATSATATSYVWTPNQGNSTTLSGASVYVVPTATTTYTVTGTNASCTVSSSVTITVNKQVEVTGVTTLCSGSTTSLTATGTGPFNWYNIATGGSAVYTGTTFATPAINTNTTYWVAGANGVRKKIFLNVPGTASASGSPLTICPGDTARLTGNYLGLFRWYTAATGGTLLGTTLSGSALPVTPAITTTYYGEAVAAKASITFVQKDSVQPWTVPPGVTSINIDAYGAQGLFGNQSNSRTSYNSLGGRVQATMNVTPGQVLYLFVGGNLWNGGGYGNQRGFGGDATDIRIGGTALTDRVLVAGGGGGVGAKGNGGYSLYNTNRGNGGGLTGQDGGTEVVGSYTTSFGRGGTQTSGGSGANYNGYAFSQQGAFGQGSGGANGSGPFQAGGGGGGGWYGGSGGALVGDGGGGSSYTSPVLCSNVIHTQGAWNSVGELTITYGINCTAPAGRIPVTINVTPNYVTTVSDTMAGYCAGSAISLYASGLAPSREVAVFNGTQDGANGMANITTVANNFTMDFWVKPANSITVVTASTGGTFGTGGQNYAIAPFQSGTNGGAGVSVGTNGISVFEHGNSYLPALLSYNGAIPNNDFTHVAVVYTNKQPALYLNGALVATGLTSTMPNVYPSIGSGGAGGYGIFSGSLDNVRIWSGALSAEEVMTVKNKADTTVAGKTLVARYSFNAGSVADDKGSPAKPSWNAPASAPQQDYYTYTWSGTGTVPAASYLEKQTTTAALGTTRYVVKVSRAGCTSTASDTLVATTDASPAGTISGTASVCKNGTSPVITFTGSGSTPPYTFSYKINGGTTQTVTTPANAVIRYVRVKQNIADYLHLAELRAIEAGTGTNVALGKGGTANSTNSSFPITNLTDNNITNYWHSQNAGSSEYVQIDLGAGYLLDHIELVNRADCCWTREANIQLILSDAAGTQYSSTTINAYQNQNNAYTTSWPVVSPAAITLAAPASTAGTYQYSLSNVKSKNGCINTATGTATVTVNEYATITTEPVTSTAVCTTNPVVLGVTATNAASYQWRKEGVNISGATAANYVKNAAVAGDAGTYNVIAVNANGCNDTSANSTVTISSMSNTLAANNATGSFTQLDGLEYNYTDASCQPIADVTDAAGNNTLGAVTAKVMVDGTVQNFRGQPYLQRHYDIVPTSNGAATVKLYATQAEFDAFNTYVTNNGNKYPKMPTSSADNAGKLNISITQYHGLASAGTTGPGGQYNVTQRELVPNSSITSSWNGSYWTLSFPVSGFSGYFIATGSASPLAIKLVDIAARNNGVVNELSWNTASEDAGDYMEVERSLDAHSFTKIGIVTGKHTNGGKYSLTDEKPATGINYYRLKLLDAGGESNYSKVVSATVKQGSFVIEAFPNPVKEVVTVRVNGVMSDNAMVSITDVSGKLLKQVDVNASSMEISLHELAAGMYLLLYKDGSHTQSVKITKQ